MSSEEREFNYKSLLTWFAKHARPLPWREHYRPYEVVLSEFMLQQTQVVTVLPYFARWLKRWPTWSDLAKAEEDEILKMWEGLGYYQRARRLWALAQHLESHSISELPKEPDKLMEYPGLGPYTSAAVASIAFNQAALPIDGNVRRVLSRYFRNTEVSPSKGQDAFLESKLMPIMKKIKRRRELAQALMELGASHCSPRQPDCKGCPLSKTCSMESVEEAMKFPLKKARPKSIPLTISYAWVESEGKVLLRQRSAKGRFPRQWEPPNFEAENGDESLAGLMKILSKRKLKKVSSTRRDFTKYKVTWNSYETTVSPSHKIEGFDFYDVDVVKKMSLIPVMGKEFNLKN